MKVTLEVSPPERYGVAYESLVAQVEFCTGTPGTRWHPPEYPHMESVVFIYDNVEVPGNDPVYANQGFLDYIERQAMEWSAEYLCTESERD